MIGQQRNCGERPYRFVNVMKFKLSVLLMYISKMAKRQETYSLNFTLETILTYCCHKSVIISVKSMLQCKFVIFFILGTEHAYRAAATCGLAPTRLVFSASANPLFFPPSLPPCPPSFLILLLTFFSHSSSIRQDSRSSTTERLPFDAMA